MKKHIEPGSTVLTDMHSMYVNLPQYTSKLAPYGYYHMWSNHSQEYVHKKFTFVHTMNIERDWGMFKKENAGVNMAMKHVNIQHYCNLYTVFKSMIKKKSKYDFWVKLLNYYYYDMYN